jgi:hypothetical protein
MTGESVSGNLLRQNGQNGSRRFHENMQLSKKAARLVTKWLHLEMKESAIQDERGMCSHLIPVEE